MQTSLDELLAHATSEDTHRDLLLTRGFYRANPETTHRSALFEVVDRSEQRATLFVNITTTA